MADGPFKLLSMSGEYLSSIYSCVVNIESYSSMI